jgi:NAD(P)H-hydrate epimerase
MKILSRAHVRDVDRRAIQEYGLSGLVLMENAGRGTTDVLCELLTKPPALPGGHATSGTAFPNPHVTIVCGKGNNGGDGFVIARHLDLRGIPVKVLLLTHPDDLGGDAAANFSIIQKVGLPIESFSAPLDIAEFDAALNGSLWLVDAILGTGAVGEPKSPYAEAIDRMNASELPILAVDLPSGLDCDTGGAARHTIRAAHTCTFVAAKPGFFTAEAAQYVGKLHVVDIGAPRRLVEEIMRSARQ